MTWNGLIAAGACLVVSQLAVLPAHADWKEGTIEGLRARNAFEIGMAWNDSKLANASILSLKGSICRLLLPANRRIVGEDGTVVAKPGSKPRVVTFKTTVGAKYRVL